MQMAYGGLLIALLRTAVQIDPILMIGQPSVDGAHSVQAAFRRCEAAREKFSHSSATARIVNLLRLKSRCHNRSGTVLQMRRLAAK
jgi:hypothetical protein